MKIRRLIFTGLIFLLGMSGSAVWADWVQDGGSLNINPGVNAGSPDLGIANGIPYAVWSENGQIYCKQCAVLMWKHVFM